MIFLIPCLAATAICFAPPAAAQGPPDMPDIGLAYTLRDLCMSDGLIDPFSIYIEPIQASVFLAEYLNSGMTAGFLSAKKGNRASDRLSMGTAHKYLGYATLAAAGVAAFSGSDDSLHCDAAYASAGLAAATAATGFYEYNYLFRRNEGMTRLNSHMVLGTLGAAGLIAAVIEAESDNSHSGLGAGGAGAMLASVVLIQFEW